MRDSESSIEVPLWARIIGRIMVPQYLIPIALGIVLSEGGLSLEDLLLVGVLSTITVGIPILIAKILHQRGILNADLTRKEDRTKPIVVIVTGSCLLVVLALVFLLDLPLSLAAFFLTVLIIFVLAYFLTLFMKVSGHCTSIAFLTAILMMSEGAVGSLLLPLTPLVCAARVITGHHTVPEVICGSVIGLVVPIAVFGWLRVS